ncbi:MAG: hypothetical protein WCP28_15770 [Actinomycetes bacterium]
MDTNQNRNRVVVAAVALGAGVLVTGGCSSGSSSTPTSAPPAPVTSAAPTVAPTTAAPAPAPATLPGPPPGAKTITAPQPDGAAMYSRFSTSQAPAAVVTYYTNALKGLGFTIASTGAGGGGWGQYGGSGAGVEAGNANTWVAVNAGGSKQGATYFEVCTGASSAIVDNCQNNNHGNSNQS